MNSKDKRKKIDLKLDSWYLLKENMAKAITIKKNLQCISHNNEELKSHDSH